MNDVVPPHNLFPPGGLSDSSASRPSACPGLLRITPARDGGLCRLRLPCGQLTAAQAQAVAAVATRCADGVLEVTNRANIQLRGIREDQADALIAELLAAGLGPSTPGGDDVRNLMVSPSAGIDPSALLDIAPLAAHLLALLQEQPRFHALSPKFALLLDGGERLAMLHHPHDLWLAAMPGAAPRFAFGLAGVPPSDASPYSALAAVAVGDAEHLVEAVLQLFLDLAQPGQTRMRHLLAELPPLLFLERLRARVHFPLMTDNAVRAWRRQPAQDDAHIGIQSQRQPGLLQVGAVPVLGRLDASQLLGLARLAVEFGDASLRFTPWQSVLLPNVPEAVAPLALRRLQDLGLNGDPMAPLVRLIACAGATGCAKALADTKADARELAGHLQATGARPAVHLSGCPRSCASAVTAPFTLLAVAAGHYDLFQRDADDSGFGRTLARHVSIEQASELLAHCFATESSVTERAATGSPTDD